VIGIISRSSKNSVKTNLIIGKPDSDDYEICALLQIANVKANGAVNAGSEEGRGLPQQ